MTTTFAVPDVSCGHCVSTITAAVAPLPGVDAVEVDLARKAVDVRGSAEPAVVRDAIEAAGYPVSA